MKLALLGFTTGQFKARMRAMRHLILFATLLLALTATTIAQECRARVHVIKHAWDNPAEVQPTALSPNQAQWWQENRKKLSNICFVASAAEADYQLSWAEKRVTRRDTLIVPTVATTSGSVRTSDGQTGTYSGTSTTNQPVESEYVKNWVQLRLTRLSNGTPELMPAYSEEKPNRWMWSNPDKEAFERAIKALSKLTKRP